MHERKAGPKRGSTLTTKATATTKTWTLLKKKGATPVRPASGHRNLVESRPD